MTLFKHLYSVLLALGLNSLCAQNLIVNPSAETAGPTSAGGGWTAVGGAPSSCYGGSDWRMPHNQSGYPVAQHGSNFFCCGCTSADREARQDVNVTAYGASIDAGAQLFYFSGWIRVYDQNPPDRAEIIVEYRNAANTIVLASYATGQQTNHAGWANFTDTRYAPVGTRFVRIRLMADQRNGASVDAYFDDLSLTTVSVLPIELLHFGVAQHEGLVHLSWTTITESNCSHYEVFRTYNGQTFELVDRTEASGQTGDYTYYKAIDYNWSGKDVAYVLIQYDLDGRAFSYGPKALVGLKEPKLVKVFYNEHMSIVIEALNEITGLEVIDMSGRVVLVLPEMVKGQQSAPELPSGMYALKAIQDTETHQPVKIFISK